MILLLGRLFVFVSIILISAQVQALDFEKELKRQDKKVTVKYLKPPKTLAAFLTHYSICQTLQGSPRMKCNVDEAKRRYAEYVEQWNDRLKEKQRLAEMSQGGEMKVSLQPKPVEGY